MTLWNNDIEIQFFTEALKNFASPEQLFYKQQNGYFAYIPKGTDAEGQTEKYYGSSSNLVKDYKKFHNKIYTRNYLCIYERGLLTGGINLGTEQKRHPSSNLIMKMNY